MHRLPAAGPTAERLAFVDALRGFALFGIFGANLYYFSGYVFVGEEQQAALATGPADAVVFWLYQFFGENKFMGLFSFLFGVSFWLFLSRAQARRGPGTELFYRRIFWLFAIGALHGWFLWLGDILRFYTLFALTLPLYLRLSSRGLLVAVVCAEFLVPGILRGIANTVLPDSGAADAAHDAWLVQGFTSASYAAAWEANYGVDWYWTFRLGDWAYMSAVYGHLLLGLYVARTLDLADLGRHRALLQRVLVIGALFGVIGNNVFAYGFLGESKDFFVVCIRRIVLEAGFLGMSLAYASALALLYLSPRWRRYVLLLAPNGQMALSFYLSQTAFGLWLFYGYMPGPQLFGQVGPVVMAMIWVAGYAVQIAAAHLWMRHFRFGPMEWLWRSLTYWQLQPMRRARRAQPLPALRMSTGLE